MPNSIHDSYHYIHISNIYPLELQLGYNINISLVILLV